MSLTFWYPCPCADPSNRVRSMWQPERVSVDNMQLGKWGHKRHSTFSHHGPLDHLLWGKLHYIVGTLKNSRRWTEAPLPYWHQLASHVSEPACMWNPPAPVKLADECTSQLVTWPLTTTKGQERWVCAWAPPTGGGAPRSHYLLGASGTSSRKGATTVYQTFDTFD